MPATPKSIDEWLRDVADRTAFPLKPKKFKKKHEDVELEVQFYRTRWLKDYFIEFNVVNRFLPRNLEFASPSTPIFTQRLKNKDVIRPNGSHPDFSLVDGNQEQLDCVKWQIVEQGRQLFRNVHSLESLLKHCRGELPEVPIERGMEHWARDLAQRIERFLDSNALPY